MEKGAKSRRHPERRRRAREPRTRNREQGLPKRILEHSHYSFPQRLNYWFKRATPLVRQGERPIPATSFRNQPLLLTRRANQHTEAFNQDSHAPIGQ